MNERIKDLYLNSLDDKQNFCYQKFAELIVRECAKKANAIALDIRIDSKLDARKYVGDGILKSFGVE